MLVTPPQYPSLLRGTLGSSLRSPAEGERQEDFPPPPDKDLESPSSTRLEALVPSRVMANRWGNNGNSDRLYFGGAPKSLQMVTAATKLKDTCSLKEKLRQPQFSSVAQSCLTLCDPMNCSTPGLPAHHQLPEFTQTPVHRVSDAIQPSHPLSSPSPPAPNPSQSCGARGGFLPRHDEDLREPLVRRQGSHVGDVALEGGRGVPGFSLASGSHPGPRLRPGKKL